MGGIFQLKQCSVLGLFFEVQPLNSVIVRIAIARNVIVSLPILLFLLYCCIRITKIYGRKD